MKLSALLSSLLLTSAGTLAAPALSGAERLARRIERRTARRGNGTAQFPIPAVVNGAATAAPGNATLYYSNWSGAIIEAPPAGTYFSIVQGSFVIPKPAPPVAGAGTWWGTAWVGIDDSVDVLQTGVDWAVTVSSKGTYSYQYDAWWEWYPNGSSDYDNITVNAGDEVFVFCDAESTNTALCAIVDNTTGAIGKAIVAAPGTTTLQGTTAEWIVEDFSFSASGDPLVPFANFGTVTFTGAEAIAYPSTVYPNAGTAAAADIVANGVVITQTTFPFETTNVVEVTYI